MRSRSSFVVAVVVTGSFAAPAGAQCSTPWQSGGGVPGADGRVNAMTAWDPDGAGPLAPRLAVGGSFTIAGAVSSARVATFDPATGAWAPLYLGVDGTVNALAALDNGELVVGGALGGAYGTLCNAIVRWNGTNWAPLGTGLSLTCNALLALPGGNLIAAGIFGSAGGVPASSIASWNGATWAPLGSGLGGPFPIGTALARMANGDVVVAGDFVSAGGVPAVGIARWNGTTWAAMPGLPAGAITELAALPNGDLIANPAGALWRWSGGAWSQFATFAGLYDRAEALDVVGNGDLVVGGMFTGIGGIAATNLARWDGAAWHAIGGPAPQFLRTAATLPGGTLFVGGEFTAFCALTARSVARWDGANWHALGNGTGSGIVAEARMPDGREVVATDDERVLRRDGTTWTALGGQLPGAVRAVAVLTNGDIIVGGDFFVSVPVPHTQLRRWDGSAWQPFAGLLMTTPQGGIGWVNTLLALPDGSFVAGGVFSYAGGQQVYSVARWVNGVWTPIGQGFATSSLVRVQVVTRLANGDLLAGGDFASGQVSPWVARWNGTTWSFPGNGIPPSLAAYGSVWALAELRDGSFAVGGSFVPVSSPNTSHVMRWNGTWSSLGTGMNHPVRALAPLPDGDLIAGGEFTTAGGVAAHGIARWNGTAWSACGPGVGVDASSFTGVRTLSWLRQGTLAVGGTFPAAGGAVSPYRAYLASSCPASVAIAGAGCAGSGGMLSLAADELPWLGGTLRTTASGLTTGSLLVRVLGVAPAAIPLATLHPAGGAGCTLWVDPLVLGPALPPHAMVVTNTLVVPLSAALIGAVVRDQIVEFELDAVGAFTRINSSNALAATIGDF
jgi:trimeric autotransporter adhesin